MLLVFLRHGSVAALLVGVALEALAFLFGLIMISPLLILLGALLFYLSEYGMHRFAFHAPPLSWPLARQMQHRLHYDHHVEPSRLDLLFLAILHYEWVHYVAHIPYQPRTRLGRWIKQYHLRHHFISEKHWFGVSNPTLDGVFGTFHGPSAAEKSATTRKLY
jgi:hypothetical protein